jgi:hypothetical protein
VDLAIARSLFAEFENLVLDPSSFVSLLSTTTTTVTSTIITIITTNIQHTYYTIIKQYEIQVLVNHGRLVVHRCGVPLVVAQRFGGVAASLLAVSIVLAMTFPSNAPAFAAANAQSTVSSASECRSIPESLPSWFSAKARGKQRPWSPPRPGLGNRHNNRKCPSGHDPRTHQKLPQQVVVRVLAGVAAIMFAVRRPG